MNKLKQSIKSNKEVCYGSHVNESERGGQRRWDASRGKLQPQKSLTYYFFERSNFEMPILQRKHKSDHASPNGTSSNMNKSSACTNLESHSAGCHIVSCAFLTAKKQGGRKREHFPLSSGASGIHSSVPQSHRAGIFVMAPSVLSALPLKNEKASIIVFSIFVSFFGDGCFSHSFFFFSSLFLFLPGQLDAGTASMCHCAPQMAHCDGADTFAAPRAAICNIQANRNVKMSQKDSLQVTLKWCPSPPPHPSRAGMYISRHDTRSDSHKSFSSRDSFPWRLTPGWFSSAPLSPSAGRRAETVCESEGRPIVQRDTRLECLNRFQRAAARWVSVLVWKWREHKACGGNDVCGRASPDVLAWWMRARGLWERGAASARGVQKQQEMSDLCRLECLWLLFFCFLDDLIPSLDKPDAIMTMMSLNNQTLVHLFFSLKS